MSFIIICTPMSEYKFLFSKLDKFVSEKSVITEVGSTKRNLLKFGSKDLFNNKWCILINSRRTKKINFVKKFWKKLGSKVIFMNAKEHDKIFAITSHLPHLIAYNLIKTAQDFQKIEKRNLIKYSAGGLRDFSRTAASNEIMWRDIFFNNKDNMIHSINKFIQNLNLIKKKIRDNKDKDIKKILINSKKVRKQIIDLKQDVSRPDFGREI